MSAIDEMRRRRTFAIISHPDAGKTTVTEKLLLFGKAIQMAGTVKGRKADAARDFRLDGAGKAARHLGDLVGHAVSLPRQHHQSARHPRTRGFFRRYLPHSDRGGLGADGDRLRQGRRRTHDQADGRLPLRDTPIITFINKLDREGRDPIELMDEVEDGSQDSLRTDHLAHRHGQEPEGCFSPAERFRAPVFRAGRGQGLFGRSHRRTGQSRGSTRCWDRSRPIFATRSNWFGVRPTSSTSTPISPPELTPVFFGSAINNFGMGRTARRLRCLRTGTHTASDARPRCGPRRGQADRFRIQNSG